MRTRRGLVVVLAVLGGWFAAPAAVAGLAAPAAAAEAAPGCSQPARPSEHRFTGTVTQLKDGGQLAIVRRDDGATVVVRARRSGDSPRRAFEDDSRYEFHPYNAASPYDDDACSATRLLGPANGDSPGGAADSLSAKVAMGAALLGAVLAAPVLARRMRRLGRPDGNGRTDSSGKHGPGDDRPPAA